MDEESTNIAMSVDCALIAAISSLAAGLSKVKGFDMSLATRTIDQYIKNPVSPDIPNRTAYEHVLESIKFLIVHPLECDADVKNPPHKPGSVVHLFSNTEEKNGE